jgi:hypothetical protein
MNNIPIIGNVYKKDNIYFVISNVIQSENSCTLIPFNANGLIATSIYNIPEKHFCHCVSPERKADQNCAFCGGEGEFFLNQISTIDDYEFIAETIREFLIKKFVD